MKKILLIAGIMAVLGCAAQAQAGVHVSIGLGPIAYYDNGVPYCYDDDTGYYVPCPAPTYYVPNYYYGGGYYPRPHYYAGHYGGHFGGGHFAGHGGVHHR